MCSLLEKNASIGALTISLENIRTEIQFLLTVLAVLEAEEDTGRVSAVLTMPLQATHTITGDRPVPTISSARCGGANDVQGLTSVFSGESKDGSDNSFRQPSGISSSGESNPLSTTLRMSGHHSTGNDGGGDSSYQKEEEVEGDTSLGAVAVGPGLMLSQMREEEEGEAKDDSSSTL